MVVYQYANFKTTNIFVYRLLPFVSFQKNSLSSYWHTTNVRSFFLHISSNVGALRGLRYTEVIKLAPMDIQNLEEAILTFATR